MKTTKKIKIISLYELPKRLYKELELDHYKEIYDKYRKKYNDPYI